MALGAPTRCDWGEGEGDVRARDGNGDGDVGSEGLRDFRFRADGEGMGLSNASGTGSGDGQAGTMAKNATNNEGLRVRAKSRGEGGQEAEWGARRTP